MFEQIIHLQDGNTATQEALKVYNSHGPRAALVHLQQWHYPGEGEMTRGPSFGTADTVHWFGAYCLYVNTALGYIGLEFDTRQGDKS